MDEKKLIEQGKELQKRFVTAFNNGDVDAIMRGYWEGREATCYMPGGTMEAHGLRQIREGYTDLFERMPGATLEINNPTFRAVGDAVCSWGTWRIKVPGQGGKQPRTLEGRYSDLAVQQEGRLVILVDHASVPMPKLEP